jgi:hypothetical protein
VARLQLIPISPQPIRRFLPLIGEEWLREAERPRAGEIADPPRIQRSTLASEKVR